MRPGTLVLLHSPLTGAAAWGSLPDVLRARDVDVLCPEIVGDTSPPYGQRYVMEAALAVHAADPAQPLVLVGHSGAGPLLPQLGFAQRAARRAVGGYVFCDAGIPRPPGTKGPASRLDLLREEDADLAARLEADLASDRRFPPWTADDLAGEVPDPVSRRALVASLRPRAYDFFTEPLPYPTDWPDAPCAYLRTSGAYAVPVRTARHRRWPVHERDSGHFAALTDPEGLADDLLRLVDLL
ncbi:MAG: hypothetical protein ACRDYU_12835 [Actinomycetes bacterium]